MKKSIFILLGTVLFWIAQLNITFACGINSYEPEVPEELR